MTTGNTREPNSMVKTALDFVPLIAFFITFKYSNLYWATAVIIVLSIVSLAVGYALTRKIAKFPLFSTALIVVMGGLTLYLQDDTYVKMKPTAVNLLFAAILGGGLYANRLFLKDLLGTAIDLPEAVWRTLTIRWAIFFVTLAALNEVIWRTMSEEAWVNFKVFGLLGLTLVFAAANAPLMARNMTERDEKSADG